MDPLSIAAATASLIGFVSSTSITLYTFVSEAKNVDQNVKELVAEVNTLQRALLQINSVLREPKIISIEENISSEESKQLWMTIDGCLDECRATVTRLDSALDGVHSKESNWAVQSFRQIKLNLKKDEINAIRIQIHSHFVSLNTALQLVNIRTTYLAPGVVTADLGPKIDMLQKSLDLLIAPLEELKLDASQTSAILVQAKSENTGKLHSLGQHILAKATTVYGSSVGDASVNGDRMTQESVLRTMEWIPEPQAAEPDLLARPISQSYTHRHSISAVDSGIDLVVTTSATPSGETDSVESDGEAEFECELTGRLLDRGQEAFAAGNHQEAINYLQKGIANFNRLPQRLRSQLDVTEVPLIIATCKYYLDEIDEASKELTTLIQQESLSDQDAVRKCQISYLLSQICLIRHDVVAAENHCRNSLKGRRRLLGKNHQDYFASLALLSEICLICGKREEATVYKDLVPTKLHGTAELLRLKSLMGNRKSTETPRKIPAIAPSSSKIPNHKVPPPVSVAESSLEKSRTAPDGQKLMGHTGDVWSLTFSPDGALLASASKDKSIRLWDVKMGREVLKIENAATRSWSSWVSIMLAFSPDGKLIASPLKDKTIRLWSSKTGQEVQKLKGKHDVNAVIFSPDGLFLASATFECMVQIWDVKAGRELRKLTDHIGSFYGCQLAFSPDGILLAAASGNKTILIWNVETGLTVRRFEGHTFYALGIAFSLEGTMVASASGDGMVRTWDLESNREVHKVEGHTGSGFGVVFSPNGKLLASGSDDRTIRIWNVKTGRSMQKIEGHSKRVNGVAFSPDGKMLASASDDLTVKLWKVSGT